jgi:carbamoyltransferase
VEGDFGTVEGERTFRLSVQAAARSLKERLPFASLTFVPHHEAHAFSASTCSPFDSSAILVLDGIGEDSSVWGGVDENGILRRLLTIADPNSLGFLWEKISEFLGFCRYDGPGKVMALAAYGKPAVEAEAFDAFIRCQAGGMFEIDDNVLECRRQGFAGLERVFGARQRGNCAWKANVAYGLQSITEKVILHVSDGLFAAVNKDRKIPILDLSLAGGVALNCVANGVLMRKGPWRRLWVQPAAHDAGTALGSALAVHRWRTGGSCRISFNNAFRGAEISARDAESALRKWGLSINRPRQMARSVAELLVAGRTVAHVNGRAEFGPRALGNRSLLADPGRTGIKDVLNRQIKQREGFRPFAPSLLRPFAAEFCGASQDASPLGSEPYHFMTAAVPVSPDIGGRFPSVTHRNAADDTLTSRIQIVEAEDSARLREILQEFGKQTGYPMLLNTSFNVSEPIVNSADDACRTFCRSGVEALALGPYLVTKNGHSWS